MMGLDRTQAMQALTYLVMACFVAGGVVSARYRRRMRAAAIALYGVAAALALTEVAVWLVGRGR
jgi:hypothetical protein